MAAYQTRIIAYDMLELVQWTALVQDFDQVEAGRYGTVFSASGAMRGQGEDSPTRWLRELLEDIREQL